MNDIILVLGAWGSGTTAITGVLDRLGAYTCPPHFNTNDPRTLCSYESVDLRNILLRYINEQDITIIGRRDHLIAELQQWFKYISENKALNNQTIAVKHPLLSIIVSDLLPALNPKIITVKRPYEDIERSRIRRKWPAIYGKLGAQQLNNSATKSLKKTDADVLNVPYKELLKSPDKYILKIAEFCALDNDALKIDNAIDFIRV